MPSTTNTSIREKKQPDWRDLYSKPPTEGDLRRARRAFDYDYGRTQARGVASGYMGVGIGGGGGM